MEKNYPILYYHFIKAPGIHSQIKGLYTTPSHFEWQLKTLINKGFTFITFGLTSPFWENALREKMLTANKTMIFFIITMI